MLPQDIMEAKDEASLPPTPPSGEEEDDLPSPPRIRRLPNRNDTDDAGDDDESDSDSDVYWMKYPIASPPPSTNCDIAEFRRRLDVVKERRARQGRAGNTPRTESPCVQCPTPNGIYCNSSRVEPYLPLHGHEPSKPISPMKDSPVSTCQTFDDITLDTTMDSPKFLNSPSQYPPLTRDNGHGRKGNCPGTEFLNLGRLMCSASEKNIDTSFAQITDTICRPKSACDDGQRSKSNKMNGRYSYEGNGEFPVDRASPVNIPANGLLDRLFCTGRSSTPKRTKRKTIKHTDETKHIGARGEFPSRRSPGCSRRACGPGINGKPKNPMYDAEQIQQHLTPIDDTDRIRSLSSRSSSFSWLRKDPWYLRSSDYAENDDEFIIDDDGYNHELHDRVMHAVVFVKGSEI